MSFIPSDIQIGGRLIGINHRPFIIAEMSGNHNQSLNRALKIVDAAARTGIDAIKLQTYTADTLTINVKRNEFLINDPNSLWFGKSLYELYQEAHTPWEWHKPIIEHCKKLDLICFSTPFDETAVDFLENLEVPCYKIASFENTDIPLIHKVASTGKPLIISTGMATVAELDESVKMARDSGCKDIILLKCTSSYPASPEDTNIRTIPHLRELFQCQVGLSDHTMGIGVAIASIALGATIIEKHFTISREDGGVDAAFSIEPSEMKSLVIETNNAWQALGEVNYGRTKEEEKSLVFRRSLYVAQDMKAGDVFTPESLRIIRPGLGLSPKYYNLLLGRQIKKDIPRGTPVSWDLI